MKGILKFFFLAALAAFIGDAMALTDVELIKKNVDELKRVLPPQWHVEMSEVKALPFQWKGELKETAGVKVSIINGQNEGKVQRPYEKKGRTITKKAQMVRYLFPQLDAGYDFPIFVRSHPDELEMVTTDYVVIRPSFAKEESDYLVPKEVKREFERVFRYPDSITKTAVELPDNDKKIMEGIASLRKSYPDKKAVLFRSSKNGGGRIFLKVVTLK